MIEQSIFGKTGDGRVVECWTLTAGAYEVSVLTYGGVIQKFVVPTSKGRRDIVLGCDSVEDYEIQKSCLGAMIGRVANRIGNAEFELNDERYTLEANDGKNCLHGGGRGFQSVIWDARVRDEALELSYTSQPEDQGFPGVLKTTIIYTLSKEGELLIDVTAVSDSDTLCNITNHSYFNISGHDAGNLSGQTLEVYSDAVTESEDGVPTGTIMDVTDTLFDLRMPVSMTERIKMMEKIHHISGFNHNYILGNGWAGATRTVARLACADLVLECETDAPGLQVYTCNYLNEAVGKDGTVYGPYSAVCLEAQAWPDAPHHKAFPSIVLKKGDVYRQKIKYRVYPD